MTKPAEQVLRWVAIPLAMLVAFVLGAILFGGSESTESVGSDSTTEHDHSEHAEAERWTCSMHPQINSGEPGSCPICGMDLIAVDSSGATSDEHPERVSLSESAKIRAKIRTTVVKQLQSGRVERRLLGRVDYDETRLRTVTSWIGGRINRLHVRTTGQRVKRGQVIATLYSPEVLGAHQDLLIATKQVQRLQNSTEAARQGAQLALGASQDRLRLLGVPTAEIAKMERAAKPSEQVKIRSPFAGTVLERLATEGSYVETGTGLFQIADLSKLWVQLDAYESDLPLLRVGQEVSLTVEALPGENFEGRVTFVDPVVSQSTRTTRVRIEVDNKRGKLRPNMFAEAVVQGGNEATDAKTLAIPETAPLFTGRRSVVYVEVADSDTPTYDARVVRLGPKANKMYPVIAGLKEGERVVTHGAFTLDADLQIRGGDSMMATPDDRLDGHFEEVVEVPPEHKPHLAAVLTGYLALQEALSADQLDDAKNAAVALVEVAKAFKPSSPKPFQDTWTPLQTHLVAHTRRMSRATSLEVARVAFIELSQQVASLLRIFGNQTNETIRLAFCPMAQDGDGAEWVQRADKIENPYFGESMYRCGDILDMVAAGTHLPLLVETEGYER